jgi:chemotaxis protein MotB
LKRKKTQDNEEKVNADRYLITYADLITLLLGLFVILYAVSRVDEEKYREFSNAFSQYFNPSSINGGEGVLQGRRDGMPEPVLPAPAPSNKSLKDIAEEARRTFSDYISSGRLKLSETASGVKLVFPEKMLFESGKAEIQKEGLDALASLAEILAGTKYEVTIDGHTDSDPIRTFRYESNWHLSTARAANVGYKLIQDGLSESSLVVRGFGAQRPVSDNATTEGKTLNRRVEITISEQSSKTMSSEGYNSSDSAVNR